MRQRFWIIAVIVITTALVIGGAALPFAVDAQTPEATRNGGSAKWVVSDQTFESQFPAGFDFSIKATSSGGRIVDAWVVWRHSASTQRRGQATVADDGMISLEWRYDAGSRIPQWAAVNHYYVLTDESGNVFQTDVFEAEYEDNTRGWIRLESEDALVFYEEGVPDEVGELTIEAMADQREFYRSNWGRLLDQKPRIIIYNTFATWAEWLPGAGTMGNVIVVGRASPEWGAVTLVHMPGNTAEETSYSLALHEVAHLYQFQTGGTVGDTWFIEGNATFFELYFDYDPIERVRGIAARGELPTLQNGGPGVRSDGQEVLAYDQGYAWWVWLTETFGEEAHFRVWDLRNNGRSVRQAIEEVTGMSFIEMETEFRTWLGASNPQAPTPFPTFAPVFPPTPTYEPTPAGN
jgi:hypothetical protein